MASIRTVVPNLRNLGLITERTEADWRRVGMMVDSPAGAKGVPAVAASWPGARDRPERLLRGC